MLGDGRFVFKTQWQLLRGALAGALVVIISAAAAEAKSIRLEVSSGLADYLLDTVCSGEAVDEAYVRSLPVVQAQVKHHTGLTEARDMDAFIKGLNAAAECRVPENDVYLFGPLVEEKEKFRAAVAFFKERSAEIEAYVAETLSPYAPEDLDYEGALVLSVVGNNYGGFSMDGRFYLALNCLRNSYEEEYETAKLLSAHETYHAIQYAFFHPFDEGINRVKTVDDAFDYLFMNLVLEGTAELAADSRALTGSGLLTDFMKDLARGAYRNLPLQTRRFGYAADILEGGGDVQQRIRDIYETGFTGGGGQVFYYVGAAMGRIIDDRYGRDALVCILALPPEQFVRAYQSAAGGEDAPALSAAMEKAANRLGKKRAKTSRYETCVSGA